MTPELKGFLLLSVIKMLVVFTVTMVGVALLTLMERKVSAWMQNRRGPNRVGPAGLLQPAADGLKNILKEETFPALASSSRPVGQSEPYPSISAPIRLGARSARSARLGTPASVVMMGTIFPEALRNAELVLPITTMAEENGTYVNRDRRIQRYNQAKSQPGMARPAWWVAGEVIAGPGPSASAPATAAQAFELLAERWPVFAGTTYDDIGFTGRVLSDSSGTFGGRHASRAGVS